MKLAIFSPNRFEKPFLEAASRPRGHELHWIDARLSPQTAALARGFEAVSGFTGDDFSRPVLAALAAGGTRLIALRSAGFNHVDLAAADELGLTVLRVPAYSPHAIAEHTVALILALNRKLHRAIPRVREQNFSLDGLMGFDLNGKTIGIVGTGQIGAVFAKIMYGFGCRLIAYDIAPNPACIALGANYVSLGELAAQSDVISLHCPLTPQTHHLVSHQFLASCKPGCMIINTSRGAVIDTKAAIDGLKSGRIGALGLDVYEEEGDLFFQDLSDKVITDDVFARLMTFPNVIVTAHQGFFTREAVGNIADTTMQNISDFAAGAIRPENRVTAAKIKRR